MAGERADALRLPLMVAENTESMRTAFTVSVDVIAGTSTGISAGDRTRTVQGLSRPTARAEDFNRPGHIFPLRAREGGVLKRAGHTEAAVDLCRMAGRQPVGVLCEIVNRRLVLAYARRTKSGAGHEQTEAAIKELRAALAAQGSTLEEHLRQQTLDEPGLRRKIAWRLTWPKAFLCSWLFRGIPKLLASDCFRCPNLDRNARLFAVSM